MRLLSLRARAVALALVVAATGCVAAEPSTSTADEVALVSEAEPVLDAIDDTLGADDKLTASSITLCGLTCPGGYHPIGYSRNFSCGTGSINDNQVTCEPNTGNAFGSCGLSCPGGYHPTGYNRDFNCGTGSINDNHVSCSINAGAQFNSCGFSCPAGYVATAFYRDFNCGTGSINNNAVSCQRLLQGDVWTSPSSIALVPGQTGSTTVGWSTSSASSVEVRAQPPGQGERSIGWGTGGQVSYGPIAAGETHTIRLYGDGVLLDTASVSAYAQTGTISASPQTVIVTGSVGTTSIAWSSQGVGNSARVFVSVNGAAATVFAGGASGTSQAPWIQANNSYRFTLRAGTSPTSPELASVVVTGQAQTLPPAINPTAGSWWNPNRSGNGFDFRVSGDSLIMYWLTYTGSGTPVWYMGVLARQPGRWSGNVTYHTWNGSSQTAVAVGTATLTLSAADRGQLAWTLNGASGSEPVERLVFGGGSGAPALSGLWYLPSESGWGLNFDTQGNTNVGYLLAYSAGGAPTWVMGAASGGGAALTFGLSRVTGTNLCPGCTGPTSTTSAAAGSMTVATQRLGSGLATTTIDAQLAGGTWRRTGVELVRLIGP